MPENLPLAPNLVWGVGVGSSGDGLGWLLVCERSFLLLASSGLFHSKALAGRWKSAIFTGRNQKPRPAFTSINIDAAGGTPRLALDLCKLNRRIAPNPVMGLWTGCTRLKIQIVADAEFRLTKKIGSVQQDCSLTTS